MLRRITRWVFSAALSVLPLCAQALPMFSVNADAGAVGDPVEVSLIQTDTLDFESATIEILFDETYLSFTAVDVGDLTSGWTQTSTPPATANSSGRLVVSLASNVPAANGTGGAMLQVGFDIIARPPGGQTDVTFQCLDLSATGGADTCLQDYDIPLTLGRVTVLRASAEIPAPSSLILMALGLVMIPALRRRSM